MNNFFKKYTQRENIDFFIVQLFSVFTITFFASLLVLNIQQSPSSDAVLQSSGHLAQNNSSTDIALSKRVHTVPVVQSSNKVNSKFENLDHTAKRASLKITNNNSTVASDENLISDETKKELANKTLVSIQASNSVDDNNQQINNYSNQQSAAIALNAASHFTNGSTDNNGVQVSSLSFSQNAVTNQSVSSTNSRQNSAAARSSSNRSNSINNNSQQNSTLQIQTSNQNFDDDGDQSLEVLGLGATSAGVTNGTRLDGSVRRECPPLDRFLERDRDRVVNIQRSLGCII